MDIKVSVEAYVTLEEWVDIDVDVENVIENLTTAQYKEVFRYMAESYSKKELVTILGITKEDLI